MNNSQEECDFEEDMDSSISSRKTILYLKDKTSDNNDYDTIWPFLFKEISEFRKITIEVLDYNIENNRSMIMKNVKIYIYQDSFKLDEGKSTNHKGIITFGRKADINFEELDQNISRRHFQIRVTNQIPSIVCLCPPPKMPTSFQITEVPFFLETNHV